MFLEFNVHEMKEGSRLFKQAVLNGNKQNKFIIVGEEEIGELDCFKVHQIANENDDITLLGGLNIEESAFFMPKKYMKEKTNFEVIELDIPKEYLTLDIIENIQRLN